MSRCAKGGEGVLLNGRRNGWRLGFLCSRADRSRWGNTTCLVFVDPTISERDSLRGAEEFFKSGACFEVSGIRGIVDPIVPLQSILKRLATDVARSDKGRASELRAAGWLVLKVREQIGLHVKAAAGGFENPHFSAMRLKKHEKT